MRELDGAKFEEEEARSRVVNLQDERKRRAAERKQLETDRRNQERHLESARRALNRVNTFMEEYVRPSETWRSQPAEAKNHARKAAEDLRQWQELADGANDRATRASDDAQAEGKARVIEAERAGLDYVDGAVVRSPCPRRVLGELQSRPYDVIAYGVEGISWQVWDIADDGPSD